MVVVVDDDVTRLVKGAGVVACASEAPTPLKLDPPTVDAGNATEELCTSVAVTRGGWDRVAFARPRPRPRPIWEGAGRLFIEEGVLALFSSQHESARAPKKAHQT